MKTRKVLGTLVLLLAMITIFPSCASSNKAITYDQRRSLMLGEKPSRHSTTKGRKSIKSQRKGLMLQDKSQYKTNKKFKKSKAHRKQKKRRKGYKRR